MKVIRAALPWVVSVFAGGWLRDRAFHAPDGEVWALADRADARAREAANTRGASEPSAVDWWRAVEQTQAEYVTAGVLVRAGDLVQA